MCGDFVYKQTLDEASHPFSRLYTLICFFVHGSCVWWHRPSVKSRPAKLMSSVVTPAEEKWNVHWCWPQVRNHCASFWGTGHGSGWFAMPWSRHRCLWMLCQGEGQGFLVLAFCAMLVLVSFTLSYMILLCCRSCLWMWYRQWATHAHTWLPPTKVLYYKVPMSWNITPVLWFYGVHYLYRPVVRCCCPDMDSHRSLCIATNAGTKQVGNHADTVFHAHGFSLPYHLKK